MSTIDITSSINPVTMREFDKYRANYAGIPFVSFDDIVLEEELGWTVVASNEGDAMRAAMRSTRGTDIRRFYPRKAFVFAMDNKGRGYAIKAERGDFRREETFFGCKVKNYEYKVFIIPVIDIVNIGFAVLKQVHWERGGDGEAHIADGYWLRNVIGAPDEFLEDIEEVQPVEARALRELRQIRRDFKKAADKATKELRKLAKTGESVTLRTFYFNEKIEVKHFDLDFFDVEDTEGDTDVWSLKTICLETNILDII